MGIFHGLLPAGAEIDDLQAAVAEGHRPVQGRAVGIGAAGALSFTHGEYCCEIRFATVEPNLTGQSTHCSLLDEVLV
jgi:hypothetical protein